MRRILILENYPPTRQALALTLRREGWEVDLVQTDQEALLALEQQEAYDVLLLEADISTGDGWRVLSALQAAHNTTPVVVMLGMEGFNQQRAWDMGACVVLTKPVGREALLTGVMTALQNPPNGAEHPSA